MMQEFATSGMTGKRKTFVLTDAQRNARAERRAVTKGEEYAALKSLFCAVGMNGNVPDPSRTNGTTHQTWASNNGVKFFGPTGNLDKTVDIFNSEKPEGCVASQHDLLKYARAEKCTHKFKYILTGGSLLDPKTAQEIIDKLLTPGGVAYVTYSASEVGTIARATFAQAIAIPGCVGKIVDGVTAELNNGELRVKVNPKLGHVENYDDKAATEKYFRDGWFYPGDKAEITKDGLLVLKGRV